MGKTKIMQLSSPDLMKVLLMLTIALVSFPILHIFAQQGDSNTDTSMSLYLSQAVNSVALLVGVAVPLIVSGLAYVKAKSQDPKIEEAAYTAIHVGQIATLTANKVLENKQHIKEVLEVGLVLAPEDAKRVLAESRAKIDQLNREIQATESQLKRLLPYIPGQANSDTIPDLPREMDF